MSFLNTLLNVGSTMFSALQPSQSSFQRMPQSAFTPQVMGPVPGGNGARGGHTGVSAGGFPDYIDKGGAGRGDERIDLIEIMNGVINGANEAWVRAEAKGRNFTLADYRKLTGLYATMNEILHQSLVGVEPAVKVQALHYIEDALKRGVRHKKRGVGLKTIEKGLRAAGELAQRLRRAGRGIASLYKAKKWGKR